MANNVMITPNDNTSMAPLNNPSQAYEASRIIKNAGGVLFSVNVYNSNASAQFVQLFDSATVPADGSVPVDVYRIAAATSLNISFGEHGKSFGAGISISNSSTGPTKTIGAADCFFSPRFK